ncbi:hypothetical protein QYE76_011007 [Lolium multiflorum]|uniref:CCHC-type domain-containing protein n=1 Tax=Lolium multiflorum TaxID=4521 RepID=A0AAD8X3M5_LOLMU|nr:hypothetical protein QYE76_011007 [Lolium multiflorum]
MSGAPGEESEAQRLEREAKQKEEADEAARNQFPPPPPPMTQQNFLQYMQMLEERQRVTMEQQNKFFQELLQQNRVERPENQGVTLSDFQNTKPISFAYAPEPMDAEDWLMDTERKLNTVGCNDLEKVRYATHLLCGPAASWWDNIVAVYPADKVFTWDEFKRKFRESNVPESIVELKRREFESLEQKDKAILTYVREFSGLSRYAVEEVNTEDKKKKRFMRGLNPQFKVQLRMLRATEFQELVDAAITLEDDFKQLQDEKRKKAKFEPKRVVSNKPNMGLSFKPRTRGICRERRVRRVKHSASSVRPKKEEADEAARNQFPPPPPPMTQQNFLQYMQMLEERQRVTMEQQNKFFQELLQQNRVERPENQGVTLSDFQNTKPISFAYAPEPMDAEDWLMDTERKLNTVGCNDLEKVRYATHLLCGPAASWWDNIVAVYPADKVFTWDEFKRKFRESNVPESIVELKRREFESLEQKDKAILTYVREFSGLSRYAVEEVNTEDKKKKRFMRGLNPQFKVQLRMLRATEFQELVDAAITLEDDFKQLQDEKRKKAKFEPKRVVSNKPNMGLSFKPRFNNNYNSRRNQAFQTANQIVCRSCGGKGHFSKDCKKPRIICFGCREEGHMLRDCPKRKNGGGQSGGGGNRGGNKLTVSHSKSNKLTVSHSN